GVPVISPVEIRIFGDNLDTLRSLAAKAELLLKNTPGAKYVNNPIKNNKTDIRVNINREKAMALCVPTSSIDQTIRVALAVYQVGTCSDPEKHDNDYDVIVSGPRAQDVTLATLQEISVDNAAGQAIPLSQLDSLEYGVSPSNIYHIDKERTV